MFACVIKTRAPSLIVPPRSEPLGIWKGGQCQAAALPNTTRGFRPGERLDRYQHPSTSSVNSALSSSALASRLFSRAFSSCCSRRHFASDTAMPACFHFQRYSVFSATPWRRERSEAVTLGPRGPCRWQCFFFGTALALLRWDLLRSRDKEIPYPASIQSGRYGRDGNRESRFHGGPRGCVEGTRDLSGRRQTLCQGASRQWENLRAEAND